ncbi:MAG: hypothetical protein R2932_26730 [Caldilineaceae bacterium]
MIRDYQDVQLEDEVGPLPHYPMIPPLHPPTKETPEPASPSPMVYLSVQQRWQYKIMTFSASEAADLTEADLDELGDDGWELASLLPTSNAVRFYFKRLER